MKSMKLFSRTVIQKFYLVTGILLLFSNFFAQGLRLDGDDIEEFYKYVGKDITEVRHKFGLPNGTDSRSDGTKIIWYEQTYSLLSYAYIDNYTFLGAYIYSPNDKILSGTLDDLVAVTLYEIWVAKYKNKEQFRFIESLVKGDNYIKRSVFRREDGMFVNCDLYKNNLGNSSFMITARARSN